MPDKSNNRKHLENPLHTFIVEYFKGNSSESMKQSAMTHEQQICPAMLLQDTTTQQKYLQIQIYVPSPFYWGHQHWHVRNNHVACLSKSNMFRDYLKRTI